MMTENPKRVAAVQMATSPNVEANLLEAEKLVAEAAEAGAGLVVLPENFAFMGKRDAEMLDLRERDGEGPLQRFLAQMAKRRRIWLVGGAIPLEADQPDRMRAACLIYDDQGRRVARYDKIHLFDVHLPGTEERYVESQTIQPGNQAVVVDSPFGKLGVAVCYDLRFPELFRKMLDQGMEMIVLPAAFTAITGKAHWEALVRARAIENLSYVVAAAQGGYHMNGRETYGHSMIVDPWGNILDHRPRGAGVVVGKIDQASQHNTRSAFPSLLHRQIRCQ